MEEGWIVENLDEMCISRAVAPVHLGCLLLCLLTRVIGDW